MATVTLLSVDSLLVTLAGWLVYRLIEWQVRLSRMRQTLPAIAVILHHGAVLRMLIPKRWQTVHLDWQFQNRKHFQFSADGPHYLVHVPLFGESTVYCYDAEGIVEITANSARYPKDLKLYSTLPHFVAR